MKNKLSEMVSGLALFFLLATPVLAAERQTLKGTVPVAVARLNLRSVGRLPSTTNLSLLIGLPLRNQAAFSNQMANLYDPTSSQYHHWLTPSQIAQRFGPTEQDYQAVIAWAKTNGFTIGATHADHLLLRVQGSVAAIEKSFHVKMEVYQHPTEARTFYAPDVEPSPDLSVPLLHITGLDNFHIAHPMLVQGASPARAMLQGDSIGLGSGPSNSYWGNDFRTVYVPGTSLTGSGQTLGLLELDNYYPADIATYISNSQLSPSVSPSVVPVDGGAGSPGSGNGEVALDIEMVIAMAPGLANVLVYEASNGGGTDWVDILKRMQEDNIAKQLSCSWSVYDDANADTCYLLFAMQGQSFFQSSGDNGAYFSGVGEWADDPNVTIVGGSVPYTSSPSGLWNQETTWQGSGGGISTGYLGNVSIPSWQQGVSMNLNAGSTSMRNVPDVSMIAAGIYTVANNGSVNTHTGGTSASAPLWAAFTALVNEQAGANSQPTVGFLNPAIYAIGLGTNYSNCFHDVASGNNTNAASPNNYFATNGYDLCTGWGSPTGTNLINALMPYTGTVWVDFNYAGSTSSENGSFAAPFKTLTQGVNTVSVNGNIWIKTAGSSAETLTIQKSMTIRAANGAATIGN